MVNFTNFWQSRSRNTPVLLYMITIGSNNYCYTTGSQPVTYVGNTYQPTAIKSNSVVQSGNIDRTAYEITVALDQTLSNVFMTYADTTSVSVYQYQAGDASFSSIQNVFNGTVQSIRRDSSVQSGNTMTIVCVLPYTQQETIGLTRCYQRQCPYAVYSAQCTVKKSQFARTATVDSFSGNTIAMSQGWNGSNSPSYYFGGILCFGTTATTTVYIVSCDQSNNLTILGDLTGLTPGTQVTLYPGCDSTLATCANLFNNANNYGGFDKIPTQNPVDDTNYFS